MTAKENLIVIGIVIVVAIALAFSLRLVTGVEDYHEGEVVYDYNALTLQQKADILEIVGEINPLYLNYDSVVFTNSITSECMKQTACQISRTSDQNAIGYRLGDSVVIKLASKEQMRTVLCHEMLHGFFKDTTNNYEGDIPHQVIRDLAEKGVCYKQ